MPLKHLSPPTLRQNGSLSTNRPTSVALLEDIVQCEALELCANQAYISIAVGI